MRVHLNAVFQPSRIRFVHIEPHGDVLSGTVLDWRQVRGLCGGGAVRVQLLPGYAPTAHFGRWLHGMGSALSPYVCESTLAEGLWERGRGSGVPSRGVCRVLRSSTRAVRSFCGGLLVLLGVPRTGEAVGPQRTRAGRVVQVVAKQDNARLLWRVRRISSGRLFGLFRSSDGYSCRAVGCASGNPRTPPRVGREGAVSRDWDLVSGGDSRLTPVDSAYPATVSRCRRGSNCRVKLCGPALAVGALSVFHPGQGLWVDHGIVPYAPEHVCVPWLCDGGVGGLRFLPMAARRR